MWLSNAYSALTYFISDSPSIGSTSLLEAMTFSLVALSTDWSRMRNLPWMKDLTFNSTWHDDFGVVICAHLFRVLVYVGSMTACFIVKKRDLDTKRDSFCQ